MEGEAAGPAQDVAADERPPKPTLIDGARYLFRGIWWLFTHPQVWHLAAVPLLVGVLLSGVLGFFGAGSLMKVIAGYIGPTSGALASFGVGLLKFLGAVLAVLVGGFLGFSLAQPLSGPALEALVRRVEADLGAPERPETPFLVDIGRALRSMLAGYALGLPPLLLLFGISTAFPPAAIVTTPLKLVVVGLTLGWDFCDYPLSVQGLRIRTRLGIMTRHGGAILGFALGLVLAGLVPCLLLLLLPAGVVGATQLIHRIERWEAAHGRDLDGLLKAP